MSYVLDVLEATSRMTKKKAIDIANNPEGHSRETLNLARLNLWGHALRAFPSSPRQKEIHQHMDKIHKAMGLTKESTYQHRIPKIANDPSDVKLDFVPNTPTRKRKRKANMGRLINPNGEWLRP